MASSIAKKILVVDDEPDVMEVVEVLLLSEGFEVITASCGEEALKIVEKLTPNLVILDIMMGELGGVETCKIMRKMANMKDIPIIMFSAKLSAIAKKESFDAGADGFITKPFNTKGFIAGIKTYLELGRM